MNNLIVFPVAAFLILTAAVGVTIFAKISRRMMRPNRTKGTL